MAYDAGFVDNTGQLAHYNMLAKIRDVAVATGWWEVLRYDTSTDNHELILRGEGYSGESEIFIGFRCYQNANADYYNMTVAGMTGYVPGNSFQTQPGYAQTSTAMHNLRIDYWLKVTPQFIYLVAKVGTPVYTHLGAGFFFPYATPSQYPYPIFIVGDLIEAPATRYDDSALQFGWYGSTARLLMRFVDGSWIRPEVSPWALQIVSTTESVRDTNGVWPLLPIELMDANNIYGTVEGIFYITGFNNAVENDLEIDSTEYIVLQSQSRTAFDAYIALELS